MSIVTQALARVHGRTCTVPLNLDPYATAKMASNDVLLTLLREATTNGKDDSLHRGIRAWYRTASSGYWLEMVRRGLAYGGDGMEAIYG